MNQAETLYARARAHHAAGRLNEASAFCQQVLKLAPDHARSLYLLGTIAYQIGRPDIAVGLMEAALRGESGIAALHSDLGEVYRVLGRREPAKAAFRQALALDPGLASALNNLAIMLHGEHRLDEALDLYRRAVERHPDWADIRMNYGCALLEKGEIEAAAAALERALAQASPSDASVRLNLGNARMAQDRPAEAVGLYRSAIACRPDYTLAEVNLGRALRELGQPEAALPHYARALAIDPALEAARWNDGVCRLLLGDYAAGWAGFARRWQAGTVPPHGLGAPEWDGGDLAGRRLLVHAEQGLGDTVQFLRFLERLRPARPVLLAQPPLLRLLRENGVDAVGPADPLPPHDLRVALLDLPGLFGITLESLPGPVPYLTAPAAPRPDGAAKRVGIVWQGRRDHANDRNRSVPLGVLAPLFRLPGIAWVSLQKEAEPPEGVEDLAPALGDFADTAAAIQSLDLVVSVDTSVAHLAGALGKPVWVMLPFAPDWRWLLAREDSPWYPTARLFRQTAPRDWTGVVERLEQNLIGWNHLITIRSSP